MFDRFMIQMLVGLVVIAAVVTGVSIWETKVRNSEKLIVTCEFAGHVYSDVVPGGEVFVDKSHIRFGTRAQYVNVPCFITPEKYWNTNGGQQ